MAGTVRGSIWALGLSGVAVSVASLVAEQPAGNAPPQMPQVAAPAAAVSGQIALDTDTVPPAVTHDYAVEVSRVAAPEAEASAPATDVVPAEPPQTLQLETVQETPAEIDESAVVVTLEEQALDTTSVVQLEIPVADADAVIATQPTAPVSEADQAAAPTDAGTADDMLIITQPTVIPAPTPPVVAQSDAAPIAVPASDELASQPSPVVAEIVQPAPIPEPEVLEQALPQEEPAVEVEAPAPVIVSPAPQTPTEPVVAQVAPQPSAPAPAPAREIRVNRLGVSASDTADSTDTENALDTVETDAPQTALHRYGTAFENANDVAMLSVLLIDDGQNGDIAARIAGLGMPVTVVLRALDPNAPDLMAAYQSAGVEVAIQTSLPAGAVPTDIEVAFEAVFGLLPQAAILYADGTGVLKNNRAATAQVMQVLAADGRGLITAQRGLSGALRAAEDAGVLAAAVMRDLDHGGETESAIVRGLDQAALRARQTGNVVLLGRAQDTTLAALATWAQSVNQSQLALAPVSAVLLATKP